MKKYIFIVGLIFLLSFVFAQQQQENENAQTKNQGTVPTQPAPKKTDYLKISVLRGKLVYKKECLSCHQEDGDGVPRMFPTLVKTQWVLGKKADLIQIVMRGSTGQVEIEGETYHNVMAPHNNLTDRQIADVLTYVRNSFGNKAIAVNAAEVKSIRDKMQ
jgi:mono/diheme cytochrome c family protein